MLLVALKRSTSELSSHQKKIFHVDDHVGVSIAGLTSDGRMLRYSAILECIVMVVDVYLQQVYADRMSELSVCVQHRFADIQTSVGSRGQYPLA